MISPCRLPFRAGARITLLVAAALAIASGSARAQVVAPGSIALRWYDCYGDGGADSRSFACDTNSGSEELIVSAYPPADMPQLNGAATILTLWFTGPTTPSWWQIGGLGCRSATSLSAEFVPPPTSTHCVDPWLGQAAGGTAYDFQYYAPNVARLRTAQALPGSVPITTGSEIFVCRLRILHLKTVGAGSCSGCLGGACIGLNSVQLTQPQGFGDYTMIYPLATTNSDVVGWQMGGVSMPATYYISHLSPAKDFTGCTSATDARRPTWGAIKRLYR